MNKVVVPFPKGQRLRTPLAQLFRIGESHLKFGEMFASGHLPVARVVFEAERRAKDISFLKPTEAQAVAARVDLASLLKRTRTHAATMGKVADALEKLHEERGTDSPRVRACDLNVAVAARRDDQR